MSFPRESKYPKYVTVKKARYKISIVNLIEKDPNILGFCYRKKPLIKLKRTKNRRKLWERFVHEVLHAMEFEYKIKIKHKAIYQFERAITNFIEDNYFV